MSPLPRVGARWDGAIAWQRSRPSNELPEGTNSLITLAQVAKRRPGATAAKAKMTTIIYLNVGKLPLSEIHTI
jgi:hypothetical protein